MKRDISKKVFKKYFGYKVLTEMVKDLVNSDKEENNGLLTSIRNRLSDLVEEVLKVDDEKVKNIHVR